ncbi:MAG: replication-associated recombination protein A [Moritella sp.]|uniref:replication-associated recombination protein A n=1 Tax=Moritella sp. TaxID=78556 RepID=UPI0029A6CB75|nr:replication-associated recombination protein A [Moritella sp.]MDX2321125.1 replication-associated recombination protein A [Moritella sp.]
MNNTMSLDFSPDFQPLAARMRPEKMSQYIGQTHILGEGKPLHRALLAGHAHSMILWGPPGTGKTTIAEMIAHYCDAKVERVHAVTSGIKDIRLAIEKAKDNAIQGFRTILFVDEVHRFNKSQQDAFLPHIEDGTIIFIGATTENPSFELNNALLSRARVYVLKKLTPSEIQQVVEQALTDERGLANVKFNFAAGVKEKLCELVDGDARKSLNYLELLNDMAEDEGQGKLISLERLMSVVGRKVNSFDNKGELYYDLMSALHKSIRGSSPDAALYWFARMLAGGCDPLHVARRLLAIASEDIGNADPRAMQVAVSAWDCFSRVGAYEGERAIAQAIVYLASAAKSNSVYTAFSHAKMLVQEQPDFDVPMHLRNAPTKLMSDLGYGDDYRYAHDEVGAYAPGECYMPEALQGTKLYHPVDRGVEKQIKQKLDYLHQLDINSPRKRYK